MFFTRYSKVCTWLVLLLSTAAPVFAAPEQAVSLSTKDGWTLAATYLPASKGKTVVLLHDLGKNKETFSSFKKALAKAGYGYVAVDLRGHGQSASRANYKSFEKEGPNNPFNKMMHDAIAAVSFLKSKGINENNILLLGTGLGANVAAKTAGAMPNLRGIALISPAINIRDVLPVPALRTYKGAVLLAASSDERKGFLEASILRNVSFLTAGAGNVTFLTAYDASSHELLDKYLTSAVVQWVATPTKPALLPDAKPALVRHTPRESEESEIIINQGLVPSVLAE
jgi:pimeloyl-ACP methyl ester carboxylesterase